jgi:hypothetical protein
MVGWRLNRMGEGLAACLAIAALFLQCLVPPGFMVGQTAGGPAIVVCTGHGPLQIKSETSGKPGKPSKSADLGICVFAGHGGVAPTPVLSIPLSTRLAVAAEPAVASPDLLPGRGLAAPPPPSQAPPALTV